MHKSIHNDLQHSGSQQWHSDFEQTVGWDEDHCRPRSSTCLKPEFPTEVLQRGVLAALWFPKPQANSEIFYVLFD